MAFEAKDETVGELLNKVVFSVPRNQRRYVWEKDNWDELLEDILFSCRSGKKAHFLGSIVLKDEGKKEGIARYTIIDGQQRITTITLILIAIMKLFVERKMQDEFLGTIDYVMTTNNRNQKMPILTSDYHLSLEKITNRIVELTVCIGADWRYYRNQCFCGASYWNCFRSNHHACRRAYHSGGTSDQYGIRRIRNV